MEVPIDEDIVADLDPLALMGHTLFTSISKQVSDRTMVEKRWVEDYRQYLGEYDEATMRAFDDDPTKSKVFLNLTRQYVNQAESQLSDMLFPSDQKNWGISPTPVPEFADALDDDSPMMDEYGVPLKHPDNPEQELTASHLAQSKMEEGKKRAMLMEREISDQHVECNFNAHGRKALHYSAVLGTGIIAGPEATTRTRYKWHDVSEEGGADGESMQVVEEIVNTKPAARCVAPWDFFPDMSATKMSESEFFYERSYLTKKQVRALAKRPLYMTEQVRALLQTGPRQTHTASGDTVVLRSLSGQSPANNHDDNRFEVWKYSGPINRDVLESSGVEFEEDDPLQEFDGVIVFSGNIILKAVLNPLETEEEIYSVFNWQVDDFCIFGYGVPYMTRHEQRIINTSWRLMLDNASKGAGPQLIMKRQGLAPLDGDYVVRPYKIWVADETVADVRGAMTSINFPNLQTEMANILQLSLSFMTQTAGLPPAVGGGAGQLPTTLGGMAMIMNASNADRRRQVRDWDDNITAPMIRRFYHWNMQYNPKKEIKGDYEVHARGTSALLLREQQAINLMAMLDKYAGHPATAEALKPHQALREIAQAMHIAPDVLVRTDDEMKSIEKRKAEQPPVQDPQQIVEQMRTEQINLRAQFTQELEKFRAESDASERAMDRQLKMDLANIDGQKHDRQLQLTALEYANRNDIDYKRILADLKKHRWKLQQDGDKFSAEVALKKESDNTANYGLE